VTSDLGRDDARSDRRPARPAPLTNPSAGQGPPLTRGNGGLEPRATPYLFVLPFFVVFAIVGLFPLLYTGWVSVHDWNLILGKGGFVGLGNFREILNDRLFWIALRNSLSIFVIAVVPQIVVALAIAAALDRNLRRATLWRMGVLLPFVVMPVAVALIFGSMFGDQYGLVNQLLGKIGLGPIGWHSDVLASHVAIATMVDYRWTGYTALILLAGMQAIPRDYYEAATMDGANPVRQFFYITLPSLRATLIFVIITATIGGLQIFDEPRLYDNRGLGGSDGQWLTLTLYLYNSGWTNLDFGRAAATAWLLFLLIAVLAVINLGITSLVAGRESGRAARLRRSRLTRDKKADS
jgi:cellobiose transport system permease protein